MGRRTEREGGRREREREKREREREVGVSVSLSFQIWHISLTIGRQAVASQEL